MMNEGVSHMLALLERKKFFGASVEDGVVRYMSVSQMAHANHKEDGGCMRKWWFRRVQRIPEPERIWHGEGTKAHEQVEHYLKTSEMVLGRIALPMKVFLPEPVEGLLIEHGLHDRPREPGEIMHDPAETMLYVADVPLTGFFDLIIPPHLCETSILMDKAGDPIVVKNPPGTFEVSDNKFYSDPETWGKREDKLPTLSQMIGYGVWGLTKFPDAQYVRLSHVYARTKRSPLALKFSVLLSADQVREKWEGEFTQLVDAVKTVAAVQQPQEEDDVPANVGEACRAYGGCTYRSRCRAFNNQSPIARVRASLSRGTMGNLFSKTQSAATNGATPAAVLSNGVPPPPTGSVQQQVALPPPPPSSAKGTMPMPPQAAAVAPAPAVPVAAPAAPTSTAIVAGAAEQRAFYIIPDGRKAMFLCMTGGKFSFLPVDANGAPNGEQPKLLEAFEPVTPWTLGTVTSAGAEVPAAPAAPATPVAPAAAAAAPKKGPGRPRKTMEIKDETTTPDKPVQAAQAATAPAVVPTVIATVPDLPGDWLFIDCQPQVKAEQLEQYIWEAADSLAKDNGCIDIRFPPSADHVLAFGRWKGALAALVRSSPPHGIFTVRSGSELGDVVIDALTSHFGPRIVRSIR